MAASLPEFRDEPAASSAALAVDASRHTTDGTSPVPAASMNAVVRAPGGEAANSATPVAKLALPAVDLPMLRLTQAVCDARFAQAAATLGALRCSATVRDTADAPAGHPAAADPAVLTFTFTTPREPARALRAAIEVDLDDYPALRIALGPAETASRPAGSAAATRHEALVLAVASLLLEPLCAKLATVRLHDLRLAGIARGRIAQIYGGPFVHLAFAASGTDAGVPDGASHIRRLHVMSLPDSTVDALDALVAARAFTPVIDELAVPGRLVLGVKRLAIDTLAQLQPGDVLLHALFPGFDAHLLASGPTAPGADGTTQHAPEPVSGGMASHGAPRAVVAWGTSGMVRLCAAVEFDGLTPVLIKEPYMSEQLDPGFADTGMPIDRADDLIRVSELELPVQFEIDTLAMPLSQLSALGPGYVIEFPVPFNDARLRLVAHGNTIGYGELVTVGDHLGVRIVRMAHKSNPPPGMDDGSI